MNIETTKNRFGIIGNSKVLERSINIALEVAKTDISVFVAGESGTGKENIPKIIHNNSNRKHNTYIAVNCGAIPEGTIDSDLFGHEKGSFTGAHDNRKGYFEVANKGTIFLDEVAELPLSTQVRLLRVLENGEFMKVGSSSPISTDVRVIAATNIDMNKAIKEGKFREDLYYRLNTINIYIPPLRERTEDISLLFKKFAADFAEKYNTESIILEEASLETLKKYRWPGNIRQLKNFVSQLSVIAKNRLIKQETINENLPQEAKKNNQPILFDKTNKSQLSEREILYKVLFDMKNDLTELKKITFDLINKNNNPNIKEDFFNDDKFTLLTKFDDSEKKEIVEIEETFSLANQEKNLIKKSLEKHSGKRKLAAKELGISERTLYRKIKEFDL